MGTQLGNVTKVYGHKQNTTVTNLNGEAILNSSYLKENTLIISSPQTINKEDIGTYSLFVTDSEGKPVRLSYTIQPGHGIVVGRNGEPEDAGDGIDVLSMAIDNWSIKVDDPDYPEALYVNKENIIDNNTLMVVTPDNDRPRIKVITDHLDHAGDTLTGYGIAKGDGSTIETHSGLLTVNTRNLDYADDETDTHGIIDANTNPERTIRATEGILSVWTQNLDRAAVDSLGVVSPDGTYTFTDANGVITVSNFTYSYAYLGTREVEYVDENNKTVSTTETYTWAEHGIVIPDLVTLGTYEIGKMHVITQGLDQASETQYGVVKPDGVSLGVTTDGLLEVKQYDKLQEIMDTFDSRYTYIINKLNELEGRIVVLETTTSAENIELDVDGSMLTTLTEPIWDEETKQVISPVENISVELRVATNCKFKVSVEYEDNINPAIVLTQVKLGSNIVVTAAGLQDYEFDSTDDTISQLKLSFECSNFTSALKKAKVSTVANIKVTSMNDASVYKKAVHTFVRHNTRNYTKITTVKPTSVPPVDKDSTSYIATYITNMEFNHVGTNDGTLNDVYDKTFEVNTYKGNKNKCLVGFNIKGPYARLELVKNQAEYVEYLNSDSANLTTRSDSSVIKRVSAVDKIKGTTLTQNKQFETLISQKKDYESEKWTYTDPQDVLPTFTNKTMVGYIGVEKYSYYQTTAYVNGEYVTVTNPLSNDWISTSLYSTYVTSPDEQNKILIKSNTPMSSNIISRFAYIKFTYNFGEGETQGEETIKYVENLSHKKSNVTAVATLNNEAPYINIVATKSSESLLKDTAYGNWSVKVGMKYVTAYGNYVNAHGTTYNVQPVEYTLVSTRGFEDTISYILNEMPEIASNIVGCKIVSVTSNSFEGNDVGFTYLTRNVWARKATPKSKYTFADAAITKIRVNAWDDLSMTIAFDIVPGKSTNIPVGAKIGELASTMDGQRVFKFFRDTSSFDWTQYYDKCSFRADDWSALGTTVYYTFYNEKATDTTIKNETSGAYTISNYTEYMESEKRYVTVNAELTHKYTEDILDLAKLNKSLAIPALNYFGYIKFWFALNANYNGTVTTTNFEVSATGLSDKIGTGGECFKYSTTIDMPITPSIINAYWRKVISTSRSTDLAVSTIKDTDKFTQSVAELRTSIDELKTVESAAILTGVNALTGTKIGSTTVSSKPTTRIKL